MFDHTSRLDFQEAHVCRFIRSISIRARLQCKGYFAQDFQPHEAPAIAKGADGQRRFVVWNNDQLHLDVGDQTMYNREQSNHLPGLEPIFDGTDTTKEVLQFHIAHLELIIRSGKIDQIACPALLL